MSVNLQTDINIHLYMVNDNGLSVNVLFRWILRGASFSRGLKLTIVDHWAILPSTRGSISQRVRTHPNLGLVVHV